MKTPNTRNLEMTNVAGSGETQNRTPRNGSFESRNVRSAKAAQTSPVVCEKRERSGKYNFVAETSGAILLFRRDANLKPAAKRWLTEMASRGSSTAIGAVGANFTR